MKLIPLLCIIISAVIVLIVAAIVIRRLVRKRNVALLLKNNLDDKNLIKKMICSEFSAGKTIVNAVIPAKRREETSDPRYYIIDCIILCRAGIVAVFTFDSVNGMINNPPKGPWTIISSQNEMPLPNPYEENRQTIISLNALMKKYSINNIPIHDVIVCKETSDKINFKYKYNNLHTADTIIPYLKDINKERFMSRREMRRTFECLSVCKNRGMALVKSSQKSEHI